MAKTLKSLFSLRHNRRAYKVAAERANAQSPAASSVIREVSDAGNESKEVAGKQEVFWMKDPKTGNWIPENHFGEVDVAELREKLLPKKANS